MGGVCHGQNVYPYTSCCVLDIHFVLKNNFCVNLMGNDFALYFVCFLSQYLYDLVHFV